MMVNVCWLVCLIIVVVANKEELSAYTTSLFTESVSLYSHLLSVSLKETGLVGKNLSLLSKAVIEIEKYHKTEDCIDSVLCNDFDILLHNSVYGRIELMNGIYSINGSNPNVYIYGHSEDVGLPYSPSYLIFSCPIQVPNIAYGGQTVVYKIDMLINKLNSTILGQNLLNEIHEYGVIYIRNDPSIYNTKFSAIWNETKSRACWQIRFVNKTKQEIMIDLSQVGYNVSWNDVDTLITKIKLPAFRKHPCKNKRVWFNGIYSWNGRYFDQHDINGMRQIPLTDRPFHTLIGNGREITDDEFKLLHIIHDEIKILIPWNHKGDVLAIDNFEYQHGRMPYNPQMERKCVVHYGPLIKYDI